VETAYPRVGAIFCIKVLERADEATICGLFFVEKMALTFRCFSEQDILKKIFGRALPFFPKKS
jgi:hypothetical protein